MILLIVEAPTKAQTIAKYLGSGYEVIASVGHVRGIPSRANAVNIDAEFTPQYEIHQKSLTQVQKLIDKARKADRILLGTDMDREGEAIAWHILEVFRANGIPINEKTCNRVVFTEITKNVILNAVQNPRPIDMSRVHAQRARQCLDYLFGYTLSPLLWRKLPGSQSAGRVQSVALRLVCERDMAIQQFIPQEYWNIFAQFIYSRASDDPQNEESKIQQQNNDVGEDFGAKLVALDSKKLEQTTISNFEQVEQIKARLLDWEFWIDDVKCTTISKAPPPPFTTSTMLQEAGHKLYFSAARTSRAAQKLYEVGLVTYIRTDSIAIAPEAAKEAGDFIVKKYGKNYYYGQQRVFKNKTKNAQEAHEAIRPTNILKAPNDVTSDEFKLYDLIWKRFIASQMANALFERTSVSVIGAQSREQYENTLKKSPNIIKKSAEKEDDESDIANNKPNTGNKTFVVDDFMSSEFRANGNIMKFDGFLVLNSKTADKNQGGEKKKDETSLKDEQETKRLMNINEQDDDNNNREIDNQSLPSLHKGEALKLKNIDESQHFTKPPAYFNEATLIKTLEELGIGRPSTYQAILALLQSRNYIELENRRFIASQRGLLVTTFLHQFFTKYVDYDFTAHLEDLLDEVANGDLRYIDVMEDFWWPFIERISTVKEMDNNVMLEAVERELRPLIRCQIPNINCFNNQLSVDTKNLFIQTEKDEKNLERVLERNNDVKYSPNANKETKSVLGPKNNNSTECDSIAYHTNNTDKDSPSSSMGVQQASSYNSLSGAQCPKCTKGSLRFKASKYGVFFGCTEYPACDLIISCHIGRSDKNEGEVDESASNTTQTAYSKILGQMIDDSGQNVEITLNNGRFGPYLSVLAVENEADKIGSQNTKDTRTRKKNTNTKNTEETTIATKGRKKKSTKIRQKARNFSIPKHLLKQEISMELAQQLISIPKVIGRHEEFDVILRVGRFGPYLGYKDAFYAVKKQNFWELSIDEAIQIIKAKDAKKDTGVKIKRATSVQRKNAKLVDGTTKTSQRISKVAKRPTTAGKSHISRSKSGDGTTGTSNRNSSKAIKKTGTRKTRTASP